VTAALAQVAQLVRARTGIVIDEARLPALAAAIGRAAPGVDSQHFLGELRGRLSGPRLMARLVDEVTIKETYFFRAQAELDAIDWPLLVETARANGSGSVRVWVAACATGEEAYTLAILASEALDTASPPVTILATDISASALNSSALALYSDRSVRNVPASLGERYFSHDARGHTVREGPKSLVRLRQHNLVDEVAPPAGEPPFDVIACRNVLIYFDPATVERVITSLEGSLRPEGRLILGAADRLSGANGRLGRDAAAGPARQPRMHALRRPLGLKQPSHPRRRTEDRVEEALWAADAGDLDAAIALVEGVLQKDPLNADAHFVHGLAELGRGNADAATESLRRALYVDPSFGLAAFQLGRAHDARGDGRAAQRSYEQALRTLDPEDERHRVILDQVDLGDIAAACRARLSDPRADTTPSD
jgi:chemotaxis protein methyltransferase CheR